MAHAWIAHTCMDHASKGSDCITHACMGHAYMDSAVIGLSCMGLVLD